MTSPFPTLVAEIIKHDTLWNNNCTSLLPAYINRKQIKQLNELAQCIVL